MSDNLFLTVKDLHKSYGEGGSYAQVLKGVSIKINKGEMCVIQGTSGSGKATLLNCVGGLDEIDSGLDVDALRIVGENVSNMVNESFGCLLITHYERLLDYIKPNFVHVMINGKIVKTGGTELIKKIDSEGYNWVRRELGIEIDNNKEEVPHAVLGSCARATK